MSNWAKIAALATLVTAIVAVLALAGQIGGTAPVVGYWLDAPETWMSSELTMPARTMRLSTCFENRGQTDAWATVTITVWNATLLLEKGTPLSNPLVFSTRLDANPAVQCWRYSITVAQGVTSFGISYDMTKWMKFEDQRQIVSSIFGTLDRKYPTHLTFNQTSRDFYERSQAY